MQQLRGASQAVFLQKVVLPASTRAQILNVVCDAVCFSQLMCEIALRDGNNSIQ